MPQDSGVRICNRVTLAYCFKVVEGGVPLQSGAYYPSIAQSRRVGPLLLIDPRRHVTSVTERSAPVPFLCLRFLSVDSVLAYLAPFRGDVRFVRALQNEMRIGTGSIPVGAPHPARLIDAVAQAVTRGQFQIAVELADRIHVLFDPIRGYERPGFDVVAFASRPVAAAFLSARLQKGATAAAFTAALLQPASAQYSGVAGIETGLGSDEPGLVERITPLLWRRCLVLQPEDQSWLRFRLLWAARSAPVTTIPDAAGAPDPAQPRRPVAAVSRPELTNRPSGTHETVQNLGVITPHFETDDAPIAPRRRNPC
jgi:hypothetical protein